MGVGFEPTKDNYQILSLTRLTAPESHRFLYAVNL